MTASSDKHYRVLNTAQGKFVVDAKGLLVTPDEVVALLNSAPSASVRSAEYAAKNPLGGPAKVFRAIADRIEAGEEYHAVLADYDLVQKSVPSSDVRSKSAGFCMYCGNVFHAKDTSNEEVARVYAETIAHDQQCPSNPLVKRIAELSAIGAPAWVRLDNYAEAVKRWGGDGVRLDRHASHFVYYVDETTQWWGFQVKYLPSAPTDGRSEK